MEHTGSKGGFSNHREHQEPSSFLDRIFEVFCFVLKLKGRERRKFKEFHLIITIKIIQFNDSNCRKHIQDTGLQLVD